MSCADVCLDMDYDNDNVFFSERIVTARKEHKCCECRQVIKIGETFEYAKGKNDDFWTAKTCADCVEIRKAFCCGSWVYGHLFEAIRESLFPVWRESSPIDCLAKVESLSARNKLREAYEEWKEGQR